MMVVEAVGIVGAPGLHLWIPCREAGQHQVTVELADGHIVDGPVSCHAAP